MAKAAHVETGRCYIGRDQVVTRRKVLQSNGIGDGAEVMVKTRYDKSEDLRINERKARVIDYVNMGWSYQRIGKEVGVSGMQVCRDMKEIMEEFKEHYLSTLEEMKLKEARRIEHLLSKLWEEFEQSKYRTIPAKLDPKTGKPVKGPQGKEQRVRVVANLDYAKEIHQLILSLWRLYGIGQDTGTTNNTLNVFNVDKLTETLVAVAKEQENSRLAEVERLQLVEKEEQDWHSLSLLEKLRSMDIKPGMTADEVEKARRAKERWEKAQSEVAETPLEKLEAMRAKEEYEKSQAALEAEKNGHSETSSEE